MFKKFFALAALTLLFSCVFAETIDLDIPAADFSEKNGFVTPEIEGYELDGAGEEVVLPFKKMFFGSEVVKVEILKKHKVVLKAPLEKGSPIFRLSDMKKIDKSRFNERKLPSLSKFTFKHRSSFKRNKKRFSFVFYPIIPLSDTEVIQIDKIRVHTKGQVMLPMDSVQRGNSLLILTNEHFLSTSTEIGNYIAAKKADGFNVDVATENNYGGGDLTGIDRAKKIREYLKSVYKNYDFLLIIADPTTNGNDVPMIVARPEDAEDPSYELVPTDMFYAELTEDIDSNGNGVYGEHEDEIEYGFELIVGRIPIYSENTVATDTILRRTIDFIKEKPNKASYRLKVLFPTTISYYANQDGAYTPKMDGAYVAEYLREDSIKEPFTSKLLVEKSGIDPSEFSTEDALTYESMIDNMNDSYGTVFWAGHGMPDYSVRTIWGGDGNNNGIPETYQFELYSETFVDTETISRVSALTPFVYQGSCLNGSIHNPGSLAYALLRHLSVGVVGASQVSYGTIFAGYNLRSHDIFSYGAVFTDAVVKNQIPAQVLFETKEDWPDYSVLLTDKLETNYIGDPSLRINVVTCSEDSDCDDSLFCNGKEVCVDGFCEQAHGAMPCEETDNPCETNYCDEAAKSCKPVPKADGSFCGVADNPCVGGKKCFDGKCITVGEKDCSHLDSFCSTGSCNTETGECFRAPLNDGASCSTGKFCIKDEVCSGGFCKGVAPDYPEAKTCNKTECSETDGFINVPDSSQNWDACTMEDGSEGYCSYGNCNAKTEKEVKSSGSGCSVLIF